MLAYFDVLYPTLLPMLTINNSAVLEDAGIESTVGYAFRNDSWRHYI
jgi:hypothetical protein